MEIKEFKRSERIVKQHVFITPELADEIIKTRNNRNRPLRRDHVNDFKSELQNGTFKEVGTITVGKSGTLLDGQHRLKAIAESGIGAYMTVVLGQDDDDFEIINEQEPLSISQYGKMLEKELPGITTLAFQGANKVIHLKMHGGTAGKRYKKRTLKRHIMDNLEDWQRICAREGMNAEYMYCKSMSCAVEFLLYQRETEKNKPKVTKFFDDLWHRNTERDTHPNQRAFADWTRNQSHTGTAGEMRFAQGLCACWDAEKNGRKLKVLRVPSDYDLDFKEEGFELKF